MKSYLLIILFCLPITSLFAQTDTCISNLKNAGVNYDGGDYDQAIVLLNATLKACPLSKADQVEAGKLLILSYIAIDNLEAADNTAAAVMKIEPNYVPDKFKDDPKLIALFSKYKPEPTLVAGISGGINFPVIKVVNTYSVVHADSNSALSSYQSVAGYQLGLNAEKRILQGLWIALGFQFRTTAYKHTIDSVQGSNIHYSEKLNYLDFPLSAKYYLLSQSFQPYLQAGVDFSYLAHALSTTQRDEESDLVDRTDLRNRFMVGYFGAVGGSYKIRSFKVFGDIRYTYFPEWVNKSGTRYADEINLYKYYYVDDDFRMNNVQINLGVSYVLSYKIIKTAK